METTTPKTGYSGAVSGTTTVGGAGQFEANRVADRAHGTVDNVTQSAHEAVDRVATKAVRAVDRMRSSGSDLQTDVSAKFGDLANAEWVESAREEVRARPLAAVGVALAAGWLLRG